MFSWVFHGIFALFDIWAENRIFLAKNRIFKNFLKCLKACLVGVFSVFQSILSVVRHIGREPDFSAENRIFKNFLKSLKTCLAECFMVFLHYSTSEPRTGFFLAKNRIFKNFLKCLKACLVGVFSVFQSIFSIVRHLGREPDFEPRTGFSKKIKSLKTSWCFLSVSRYFSIVLNLSREPHFWAENRIFKNFSKSLKTCLVGVFWVF